ncbi:glycosyltransferase family 2 protein [Ruficoccus sp. ZRK36]|uniref:glycosyltransferase family 2 protein n=1 Tax=Ruficoccus sp. ZRK36 TaxID=2866311 RepID=UPI001C736F60|nr:glycosyltransferase family 2 protein [Ruficoccus sp. ZRK36]QYY36319.1 glycosyltransferase [Ruficoccus sp. ZRK36]
MSEAPLITVITPVLNCARFITACMESVATQDCTLVEHLIVDGLSTDGTPELVRDFAATHPHVRLISEKDCGQSDAMNHGIREANTPYIGFLNADDYYAPNTLNRVCGLAKGLPEPAFLYANLHVWGDDDKDLGLQKPAPLSLYNLCRGKPFPLNPASYFYHKSLHEVAGPYDIDDHMTMDLDFIFRACQHAHIHYYDECWGHFRLIEGTKTQGELSTGATFKRQRVLVNKYINDLPLPCKLRAKVLNAMEPIQRKIARRLKRI